MQELSTKEIREWMQELSTKEIREWMQELSTKEIREWMQELSTKEIREWMQELSTKHIAKKNVNTYYFHKIKFAWTQQRSNQWNATVWMPSNRLSCPISPSDAAPSESDRASPGKPRHNQSQLIKWQKNESAGRPNHHQSQLSKWQLIQWQKTSKDLTVPFTYYFGRKNWSNNENQTSNNLILI